jgi:hypothetical protein
MNSYGEIRCYAGASEYVYLIAHPFFFFLLAVTPRGCVQNHVSFAMPTAHADHADFPTGISTTLNKHVFGCLK